MDTVLQDARYAIRGFARSPLFTMAAALTVAIGIGANATVFSLVNALLLRPAPGVANPATLVSVFTSDYSSGPYGASSYPDFESISAEADAFSAVAAFREAPALLRLDDSVERVRTMAVSGRFFDVVGIRPAAGRLLTEPDVAESAAIVVIGYALWQRAFGAMPEVIGRSVTLNDAPHVIVGVAPERFDGLNLGGAFEIFMPLPAARVSSPRGNRGLSIVGRLRAGISVRQAQTQLDAIAARLAVAYPDSNRGTLARPDQPRPMFVLPHTRLHPTFRAEVAMISGVLLAAVGSVLLVACANVAGLLLSRATARQREVAVRLALGATRRRLMRQMLTESVLLAIVGGAVGLLFTLWTADVLPSFFPAEQARILDARVDGRVMLFTALTALGSGALVGLAPAFQGLRWSGTAALRGDLGQMSDGRFGTRARAALVVGQIAVATTLLIGAAVLAQSLSKALDADLGFETRSAILATVELPEGRPADAAQAFYRTVVESVAALPGIEKAAIARFVPVAGTERRPFRMEGYASRAGEDRELHFNRVSRDFFATMQTRLIAGRTFTDVDTPTSQRVVVVNELLANRYYGGQAVGKRMNDGDADLEIIGVVAASRRLSLQDPPMPVVFYPIEQQPSQRVIVIGRSAVDPAPLAEVFRRTLMNVDRSAAVFRTVTLEAHLAEALATNRLTVALVSVCGAMALLLSAVGIYGMVAFAVARRTREIGVRVALGAGPRQIVRLIVGQGGRVVAAGIGLGMLAALAGNRFLISMLYGVSASDPLTFLAVPTLLGVVAVLAGALPALRALRLNPVVALRQE